MSRINFKSLGTQVVIALVAGIVAGILLQGMPEAVTEYIRLFGKIFLNLLKFIVVPLVLFSIVCSIISMNDLKSLGILGTRSVVYFMVTTLIAVTLGLTVSTAFGNYYPSLSFKTGEAAEAVNVTLSDQILNFFPQNALEPLLTNSMMQVIVIAVFIAVAIIKTGEKAKPVAELIVSANEVTTTILRFIMALAPIGVFCLVCPVVAENGAKVLGTFAVLMGVAYFSFLLHAIIVYGGFVAAIGRMSPLRFFREMIPAMLFAFSSSSGLATLPVTKRCVERLGVNSKISSFVLPLGATINMDGVAIYLGTAAVFIAHCCGIELSMSDYFAIALSCTIASIGTPGIPGGSLALMAMVFASANIPIEGVALVAGIDRIIDMARTTMSITGDASCAVVMQKITEKER